MNNRDYKQFAPGSVYHIYNRGVGKMNIFLDEEDYILFLKRMNEILYPSRSLSPLKKRYTPTRLPDGAFDLLIYCLMPNHFHLVLRQNTKVSISSFLLKLCTGYSKCFNKKYNRVGSLFRDRSKAVMVESNEQLLWLTSYVHKNPLKAGIVKDLKNYPYSSYLDYSGLREGKLCNKSIVMSQFNSVYDYMNSVMNLKEDLVLGNLKIDEDD